ncbi:MAG: hypothetical protein ACOYN0_03710 [Phycisphaerales bacterium]
MLAVEWTRGADAEVGRWNMTTQLLVELDTLVVPDSLPPWTGVAQPRPADPVMYDEEDEELEDDEDVFGDDEEFTEEETFEEDDEDFLEDDDEAEVEEGEEDADDDDDDDY